MDLVAYSQIGNIDELAKENAISVPRLRGYRMMEDEKPKSNEEIEELINDQAMWILERSMRSCPQRFRPDSNIIEDSPSTDKLVKKYLIAQLDEYNLKEVIGIKWNLIHGKDRKAIKFALKKSRRRIQKQFDTFNKYVGRKDVLYIHARIGGANWAYYDGPDIERQPWFIEKVDDGFDDTYCDIYAKIVTESM